MDRSGHVRSHRNNGFFITNFFAMQVRSITFAGLRRGWIRVGPAVALANHITRQLLELVIHISSTAQSF